MAAEWEAPPPVYAQLDVSALFTDAEGGIIREVEMEEDSDGETSSNRDAQRKLPRKSKGGSEPEAVVSVSRWERMDDADAEDDPSDNKRLKTSVSKGPSTDGKAGDRNHSSCELHDAIRRAHKKQVRWADEEEEVEGFHIGGIRRQLEDVHYIDDLGEELDDAEVEATRQGDSASRSCDVTTFAQRVKAEHTAFRSMHLKGVLKSSAKAPS
ncbi:unnamed protein product [Ostreobium quekettii]|uniref:Uncharacterized protein n=1 Tax=Ostreobium quekettii TaxID=121088 RepID=A0A8S1J272_9CHLO|nr:unnamed protein product [Ostreobium quekettii]